MKVVFTGKLVKGVPVPDDPGRVAGALSKFKPGASLEFVVQTPRHPRTLDQNARFWKLLDCFAEWGWRKDEAHDWVCEKFLPPIVRELPDGTRVELRRGTSGLSTIEFAKLMDDLEGWLNQQGVWLPEGA